MGSVESLLLAITVAPEVHAGVLAAAFDDEVGSMLAKSELSDVVDAHVVLTAARRRSIVVTSDPGDIKLLASTLAHRVIVSAI